jgi:hypothetical protein
VDICGGQLLIVTLPWVGRAPAAPADPDGTALPGEQGEVLIDRGPAQAGHPHELGYIGPAFGHVAEGKPEHVFRGTAAVTARYVFGLVGDARGGGQVPRGVLTACNLCLTARANAIKSHVSTTPTFGFRPA